MEGLELYEKVRSVPDNAKKTIKGGRLNGYSDINPMWRIKMLTEQFGPCGIGWYYQPTRKWLETSGNETAAFVDIELYVKAGGEWSKPIHGTGGSMFAAKERSGIYVSDECYKMATTDAISVACKQLGIGADVYWEADRTKYDGPQSREDTSQPKEPAQNKAPAQSACLTGEQINNLYNECGRTGKHWKDICASYNVKQFKEMDQWQYEDAMKRFSYTADKPVAANKPDPAMTPPDEPQNTELPWNTPER